MNTKFGRLILADWKDLAKLLGIAAIVAIATGMLSFAAAAQQKDVAELSGLATNDEAIDEIVVVGEKSMANMRQEIYRAEEDFFELFSIMNDDDDFDVRCFYETPTGTRIREHVCRAQFVTDANSRAAARYVGGVTGPYQDPEVVVMQKSRELEQRMTTLIAENPELQEALDKYTNTRDAYITERARRYSSSDEDKIPDE